MLTRGGSSPGRPIGRGNTLGRTGWLGVAATVGLVWLLATPITIETLRTTAPSGEEDVERFGGPEQLTQTFVSPADGLTALSFALRFPSPAEAFPMTVAIRHGRYSVSDLRTVTVGREALSEDGTLTVRFAPLPRSGGRPYVFSLTAPAAPRRAVAVSREIDSTRYPDGHLFRQGSERPGDLAFALRSRRTLGALAAERLADLVHDTRDFHRTLRLAIPLGLVGFAALAVPQRAVPRSRASVRLGQSLFLSILVVVHLALHQTFIAESPGVNDEGAVLMDVQNAARGIWPFRDTLAKGPLFLAALAPVVQAFPASLNAARWFTAALSSLAVPLLFAVGRSLGGTITGVLAAVLWAVHPAVLLATSQVFPQPLELLAVLGASLALLSRTPRPRLAGVLLATAYLVRASAVAFLPTALMLAWQSAAAPTLRLPALRRLAGAFLATLLLFALAALPVLGLPRTAVLFNLEAYAIGQARAGAGDSSDLLHPREILERLVAHGATLIRTAPLLLLLSLAFLADRLRLLLRLPPLAGAALFISAALLLAGRARTAGFFLTGEVSALAPLTTVLLIATGVALLPLLARKDLPDRRAVRRELALLATGWLFLALAYGQFGRFRQHYHLEFLPLYVLGAASLLGRARASARSFRQRLPAAVVAGLVAASLPLSFVAARHAPPLTGSHDRDALAAVVARLRGLTAPSEEIFTAQPLYAYLAARPLPFGIAHPGWYLEEEVHRTVPASLRRLLLPDKEVVREHLRRGPIRLVAVDRRTREVYLNRDPAMRELLAREFSLVATIANPLEDDPVEIFERRPSPEEE